MWAVFVDKAKDPNGVLIVGRHEASSDPQALYVALLKHYTESQTAVLRANDLHKKSSAESQTAVLRANDLRKKSSAHVSQRPGQTH